MSRKGNCWDNAPVELFRKRSSKSCLSLSLLPRGIWASGGSLNTSRFGYTDNVTSFRVFGPSGKSRAVRSGGRQHQCPCLLTPCPSKTGKASQCIATDSVMTSLVGQSAFFLPALSRKQGGARSSCTSHRRWCTRSPEGLHRYVHKAPRQRVCF